jgi:hypothetical protein
MRIHIVTFLVVWIISKIILMSVTISAIPAKQVPSATLSTVVHIVPSASPTPGNSGNIPNEGKTARPQVGHSPISKRRHSGTVPSVTVTAPSPEPSSRTAYVPTNQNASSQPSIDPSVRPSSLPSLIPTTQPSSRPSCLPSRQPSVFPTSQPSIIPTSRPSSYPSIIPTRQPSSQPSSHPATQPTSQPYSSPSCRPSSQPSDKPSSQPTRQPTARPSDQPTVQPSRQPTVRPTIRPSSHPSVQPTIFPTMRPTEQPTSQPSKLSSTQPSSRPTKQPISVPSSSPSSQPSTQPSRQPTLQPSVQPSLQPSSQPTCHPTAQPSLQPSSQPTNQPSNQPSIEPTTQPMTRPSSPPTGQPVSFPTVHPSTQPTSRPSNYPSCRPSSHPSSQPSARPSLHLISQPSSQASEQPSIQPTGQPSFHPSLQPSTIPTTQPTALPSSNPSHVPTKQSSAQPFSRPSIRPTSRPSNCPSYQPSSQPSVKPSTQPTKQPSTQPTVQPTSRPSSQPSTQSIILPAVGPTEHPTIEPSAESSSQPSSLPSPQQTSFPSSIPSLFPSRLPANQPSSLPSGHPSSTPSIDPTSRPTCPPITLPSSTSSRPPTTIPTENPTNLPTTVPSIQPTSLPFSSLSNRPTCQPSFNPTILPTDCSSSRPNSLPTVLPSVQPIDSPASQPSSLLSNQPTFCSSSLSTCKPTPLPTPNPSAQSTIIPSVQQPVSSTAPQPTTQPVSFPTESPSSFPSRQPTSHLSSTPSIQPVVRPSNHPTLQPFSAPTVIPSCQPFARPTSFPSNQPTRIPSNQPNSFPTSSPTRQPTVIPTIQPFGFPTSAPIANIYQTKGVLFYPGNPIYSDDPLTKSSEILGSSYILFGKKFHPEGSFPLIVSLQTDRSKEFTTLLNDGISGITSDTMTRSTTVLGDINKDGYLDVMIGFPLESKCLVYLGNLFGVDHMASFQIVGDPEREGGQLGWASIRVDDLNHDEFDEIVVSAPFANVVYCIYGRREFINDIIINELTAKGGFKIIGSQQDTYFGVSLAPVHDFNKDGYQDLAITAVRPGGANVIYLLLGNSEFGKKDIQIDQLLATNRSSCIRIIAPYLSYGGYSIAGIGDINSDGYDDLAIGSIPVSNARYTEQKTYIIYGRQIINHYDFNLNEITPKDGFIITGGGFLVQAVDDVNGDGMNDMMITSYYEWRQKGNAYLIQFPVEVNPSPTFQPSSSPSKPRPTSGSPSSYPSKMEIQFPTNVPTLEETTNQPVSEGTFPPFLEATQLPSIAPKTSRPTRIPSVKPSTRSSTVKTSLPSVSPTTRNPTGKPTLPPKTDKPSRTLTPRRVRNSGFPTSTPSPTSLESISGLFEDVVIDKQGIYKEAFGNSNFIITGEGSFEITGNSGGKKLYTIIPSKNTITIIDFNKEYDQISLVRFPYLYSIDDLVYRTNPLQIFLSTEQKVILLGVDATDLTAQNFVFQTTDENKKTESVQLSFSAVVSLGVSVAWFALFAFLVKINEVPEKDDNTVSKILLQENNEAPSLQLSSASGSFVMSSDESESEHTSRKSTFGSLKSWFSLSNEDEKSMDSFRENPMSDNKLGLMEENNNKRRDGFSLYEPADQDWFNNLLSEIDYQEEKNRRVFYIHG